MKSVFAGCRDILASFAIALVMGCLANRAAAIGPFLDVPTALANMSDSQIFWRACQTAGLQADTVFTNPRWEALLYVPTDTAMQNYFDSVAAATQQEYTETNFLSSPNLLDILLHHIVSSYSFNTFNFFYNDQVQPTLLTRLNNRSKLRITEVPFGKLVNRTITAERSTATMSNIKIIAGLARIIPITDTILLPDLDTPTILTPKCSSAYDALVNTPGLEDLVYALQQTPDIVALLQNASNTMTMFAPNNYAIRWVTKATGKLPEALFLDPSWVSTVIPYHILPDVYLYAATLYEGQTLTTSIPGHPLTVALYHNHIVPVGDKTKGKLVPQFPRKLPSVMPNTLKGSYDVKCGKHMVHVMDAWLLPNVQPQQPATSPVA